MAPLINLTNGLHNFDSGAAGYAGVFASTPSAAGGEVMDPRQAAMGEPKHLLLG